jgi:hypothetical protein
VDFPALPAAISARVVPVGYSHIGHLLYGEHNVAIIKRVSGWRRTDATFPVALSVGRSPTFNVNEVWEWLRARHGRTDGRTRESIAAMTQLQSDRSSDVARRHLLLAAQAIRSETGDDRVRLLIAELAALRRISLGNLPEYGRQLSSWLLPPDVAQEIFDLAIDPTVNPEEFLVETARMMAGHVHRNDDGAYMFDSVATVSIAADLRSLAASSICELEPNELSEVVEMLLSGEEAAGSPHFDVSSTSGDAAQLVAQVVQGLRQDSPGVWRDVYDPAVGEGRLLSLLARHEDWRVFGQDSNLSALRIAAARMICAGVPADLRLTTDSLKADEFRHQTFDLVVTDPPLPGAGSGSARRRTPQMGPWWSHVMDKLAGPYARAVILSTDQRASQPPDEWRASGHVLAEVETGVRLRRDAPGNTVLWVLSGSKVEAGERELDLLMRSTLMHQMLSGADTTQIPPHRSRSDSESKVARLATLRTEVAKLLSELPEPVRGEQRKIFVAEI